ncbi:glycosyl transferase [Mariannaea sp. PMI_226]|nr:glycosyl transferase [Mariannaea sp. PMI_226]
MLSTNALSRLARVTLTGAIVIIAFVSFWHLYNATIPTAYAASGSSIRTNLSEQSIPNVAHYVYIIKDPSCELVFNFSDALSVYAAWHFWHPDAIYLHTNAPEESINRAREGLSGQWSRLIFDIPGLQAKHVSVRTHARNGVAINLIEHKSDFFRVQAIREFGGVYIDFDVHPLRDVQVLRESGFQAIGGGQLGGQLNSGAFMSKKGSKLINLWAEDMHKAYDGGWTTHSNDVITRLGEQLVADPGEMLIMEREAFAPGSWNDVDCINLFGVHNETTSDLEHMDLEAHLPSFDINSPEISPSWATDWSRTYLLHAFKPQRSGVSVYGFNRITPKYVLERRSNFARAVYPIARILHDRGLLGLNDSH